MVDRFKKQWETLGKEDPYWAVLSDPEKKGGRWSEEDFFQTGDDEIKSLLARISQLGLTPSFDVALDYGCGVGRLSRALSGAFERVIGVDILQPGTATLAQNFSGLNNQGILPGASRQWGAGFPDSINAKQKNNRWHGSLLFWQPGE